MLVYKIKITHCKLKKSIQNKLLKFFVLEVTVRAAADLLCIHANSAILFYRKIREVISYHLALEADEVLMVKSSLMKAILAVIVKENEV